MKQTQTTKRLNSNVTLLIQNPPILTGQIAIDLDPELGRELAWLLSRYQGQHAPTVITPEDALRLAILDAADCLHGAEISEGRG